MLQDPTAFFKSFDKKVSNRNEKENRFSLESILFKNISHL